MVESKRTMEDQIDIKLFRKESEPKTGFTLSYPIEKFAIEYNMTHRHRGKSHIFNQRTFSSDILPDRPGTEIDRDRCYEMLTNLGFDVKVHKDPKLEDITDVVRKESAADHMDEDCIAFVMLSHGEDNGEIHAYDRSYELSCIYDLLTPEKCPSLTGKPKLFFVQACRGTWKDRGASVRFGVGLRGLRRHKMSKPFTIPLYTDLFVAYATLPGFVAWRNSAKGSPFIETLCRTFNSEWQQHNILIMMTLVIQRVAINYQTNPDQFKLSPCFLSNLTRVLRFSKKVEK